MRRLLAVTSILAALVPAGVSEAAGYRSKALGGTVHYSVYLPKGYATSAKRYPVVYFLHGLPAGSDAYSRLGWVAKDLRDAIVVAPQGARRNDADPEWIDWGSGRNWETWVAGELVPEIDRRYRTIANRRGRALIGFSAGGYGAALIGYHHPGVFSVIQSWSGYFRPTNPQGTAVLDLGSKQANDWASLHAIVPKMRKRLGSYYRSTYFGFYVGKGDKRFLAENKRLAAEMAKYGVPNHLFRVYRGGHTMALWRAHAAAWLSSALSRLQPTSTAAG